MNRSSSQLTVGLALLVLLMSARSLAEEPASARGAELLAPFKVELKKALVAGMQQGPVQAVSVCKDQAPAIAASLTTADTRIGRTSHRLRNPENSGPDWVNGVLQAYLESKQELAPQVVELADNREGYVEPIMTQPLCLACHGKTLAPELAAHIEKAYPEDQARGFEAGDLRGVFWVEYSKPLP